MNSITRLFILFFSLVFSMSGESGAWEVVKAPEYDQLFDRREGWTGADGTYSYLLDDGSVMWSFSDTFFGRVVDGRRVDFVMWNNSQVLQSLNGLTFLKSPAFVPPDKVGWFWMHDGVFEDDFKVLLSRIEQKGEGAFGFQQTGLWFARAELESDRLVVREYVKLPFFKLRNKEVVNFGTAVFREGAWDYIMGTRDAGDKRSAVLARVPKGCLGLPGVWRFYDGKSWVRDPWASAPLFSDAAMEASVHRTRDGGYLCIHSVGLFGEVVARYAPTPSGPWSKAVEVYRAPEAGGQVFVYNAKAHPELSKDGRLLISYNVNTFDLNQVVNEADIYRPRFIWWTPQDSGWLP